MSNVNIRKEAIGTARRTPLPTYRLDTVRVENLLRDKLLTKRDLAFHSRLSYTSVINAVKGRACSMETARRVARALGVKPDELIVKPAGAESIVG